MSCAGCAPRIERMLRQVPGVENARVDFESGSAVVEWSTKRPDLQALAKVVESVEGKAIFEAPNSQATTGGEPL